MIIDYMPPNEFYEVLGKLAFICYENECDSVHLKFDINGWAVAADIRFNKVKDGDYHDRT